MQQKNKKIAFYSLPVAVLLTVFILVYHSHYKEATQCLSPIESRHQPADNLSAIAIDSAQADRLQAYVTQLRHEVIYPTQKMADCYYYLGAYYAHRNDTTALRYLHIANKKMNNRQAQQKGHINFYYTELIAEEMAYRRLTDSPARNLENLAAYYAKQAMTYYEAAHDTIGYQATQQLLTTLAGHPLADTIAHPALQANDWQTIARKQGELAVCTEVLRYQVRPRKPTIWQRLTIPMLLVFTMMVLSLHVFYMRNIKEPLQEIENFHQRQILYQAERAKVRDQQRARVMQQIQDNVEQHDLLHTLKWNDYTKFRHQINLYLLNLATIVEQKNEQINPTDIQIYTLTLLGYNISDYATLLCKSPSSIQTLRRRAAQKLGIKKGDLYETLIDILAQNND